MFMKNNKIDQIEQLLNSDLLNDLLPNNTDKTIVRDGIKIHVTKNNGNFSCEVTTEDYDDEAIKEYTANFKKQIGKLDDCLFVDAFDVIKKKIDSKEFDRLLDLKKFTREEADKTYKMIKYSNNVFKEFLKNKMSQLNELYKYFA